MSPILFRAAARWHLRHPLQLLLSVLGIVLGVAVVVAVDIASASARRAFLLSTESVSGRATHELLGGPGGLPDTLYSALRVGAGIDSIAPVIDRHIRVEADGRTRVLRMLGIDPFAESPFRPYVAPAAGQLDFSDLLTRRTVLLAAATAAQLGLQVGDELSVNVGTLTTSARLGGVLEPADALAERALRDLMLADVATAQELTGAAGVLDRIELRLSDAAAAGLRAGLPAYARLLETGARTGATVRLTRAFDTNLAALALVALVFAMFLIYNSVTFSLVQRRPLIGLLRAQGVTAREVLALVLAEAALLGVAATAAGIAVGLLLGSRLLGLVSRTINDLYFTVSVTAVELTAATFITAVVLGIGATLLASLPPALEAVRTPPRGTLARSLLERRAHGRAVRLAFAATFVAGIAALTLLLPSRSVTLGFAALFVLILAAALVTPAATLALMAGLRPLAAAAGPVARLATRGVAASLSRTAPAIAALGVAIAVGIAVTIMIGSFRTGVVNWLESSLQADIYVSAPDLGADRTEVPLGAGLPAQVAALPGVSGVTTYRHTSLLLEGSFVRLIAADFHAPHRTAFELLDGRADAAWPDFAAGGVLISEPLAFRRGLRDGDAIVLPTDRGPVTARVAAVFRDYASEHGVIFIDRASYDRLWDDDALTSLGVFLTAGADGDALLDAIRALPAAAGVVARSNVALRESSLAVFDRTFVITGVLRLLSLIVAFVGVTGALMALQLERAREIGVLRATGLTPTQVWSLVTAQTGLMGLAAALLALPLGYAMSWAMVNVVNRRAFGWSFEMVAGAAPFAQALLVGLGAALLAGIYPAWRMSRIRPATAVRTE
jgi:putative ABC transport system permease protein